jgi:hypothetical protein
MKRSKIQHPGSREVSNTSIQSVVPAPGGFWSLKLGTSLAVACCLLFLLTVHAHAQNYSIKWFTIDGGGGGVSTGGPFSVTGTIGQPNAGKMSGGNFSVEGGFWSVIAAVQEPGAPLLSITFSSGLAVISWPSTSAGFVLQENNNLSLANWTAVAQSMSTNNGQISVTVPASAGYKFYRLKK